MRRYPIPHKRAEIADGASPSTVGGGNDRTCTETAPHWTVTATKFALNGPQKPYLPELCTLHFAFCTEPPILRTQYLSFLHTLGVNMSLSLWNRICGAVKPSLCR
jgi:hypothetical protein